jgi:hypothetical protein
MTRTLVRVALASTLVCLSAAGYAEPPEDVGTLEGYAMGRPRNLDNHGDLVGLASRPGPEPTSQAVLWERTRDGYDLEALPPLANLPRSEAQGFGRRGTPVGYSFVSAGGVSLFRAVAWRKDVSGLRVAEDLEPPPGFTDALAFAGNHHGLVVGAASNPGETVNGLTRRQAVAWEPGKDGYEVTELGVPEGYDVSDAAGVNQLGEIVGTAVRRESDGGGGFVQRTAVVVWRRGCHRHGRSEVEAFVLPLPEDLPRGTSPAISTPGVVVVRAERSTPGEPLVSRPLFWIRRGHGFAGPYELPVPDGFTDAFPTDVNEVGAVLGTALLRQSTFPTLASSQVVVWTWWHKGGYRATVLPNPEGAAIVTSTALNEKGDALGFASPAPPGGSGGYIWKKAAWGQDHERHGHSERERGHR